MTETQLIRRIVEIQGMPEHVRREWQSVERCIQLRITSTGGKYKWRARTPSGEYQPCDGYEEAVSIRDQDTEVVIPPQQSLRDRIRVDAPDSRYGYFVVTVDGASVGLTLLQVEELGVKITEAMSAHTREMYEEITSLTDALDAEREMGDK